MRKIMNLKENFFKYFYFENKIIYLIILLPISLFIGSIINNLFIIIIIITYLFQLQKKKKFEFNLPKEHNSFIYLLKGELTVGNNKHEKTSDSNLILLNKGTDLIVEANKMSEFLFIAGKPIGEEIARGGPFVMNTKEEINQAIKDYQDGTFAKY